MSDAEPKQDLTPLSKALLEELRNTYGNNTFTSVVDKIGSKRNGPWRVRFWGTSCNTGRYAQRSASWSSMLALERRQLVHWRGKVKGKNTWTLVKPAFPLHRTSKREEVNKKLRLLLQDLPEDL